MSNERRGAHPVPVYRQGYRSIGADGKHGVHCSWDL